MRWRENAIEDATGRRPNGRGAAKRISKWAAGTERDKKETRLVWRILARQWEDGMSPVYGVRSSS